MSRWITCLEWQYTSARASDAMYLHSVAPVLVSTYQRHTSNSSQIRQAPEATPEVLIRSETAKGDMSRVRNSAGQSDRAAAREATKWKRSDQSDWESMGPRDVAVQKV